MNNMYSFFCRLCHSSILRLATVILVALASGILSSCDWKHNCKTNSVLSDTSTSGSKLTTEIKAQALVVVSDGSELMIGDVGVLVDNGNGRYSGPSISNTITIWFFRNFNKLSPDYLHVLQEDGIQPGKAYLK